MAFVIYIRKFKQNGTQVRFRKWLLVREGGEQGDPQYFESEAAAWRYATDKHADLCALNKETKTEKYIKVLREEQIGKRGFASVSDTMRKSLAHAGGEAAHKKGTAHRFTKTTAAEAGRKGGLALKNKRQEVKA